MLLTLPCSAECCGSWNGLTSEKERRFVLTNRSAFFAKVMREKMVCLRLEEAIY